MPRRRALHHYAFFVPLVIYTILLLVPRPLPPVGVRPDLMYYIQKGAHAGGYLYLTAVGFLLPHRPAARWWVVGLMMLHGVGTEIGQTFVPGRSGEAKDVVIDWCGIAVGQYVARRISRYLAAKIRPEPAPTGSQPAPARPE